MIIKQYETPKYSGLRFFVDQNKQLFAVMGRITSLHENGLIDEDGFKEASKDERLKYGVIFKEERDLLFKVENLTKGRNLIETVKEVLENERRAKATS